MAKPTMDPLAFLRKTIEDADPDLLREMVRTFAETLMSAEASAIAGAAYGERSPERTNQRNGYRSRRWDTRAGSIDLGIPSRSAIARALLRPGKPMIRRYVGRSVSVSNSTDAFSTRDVP